MPADVSKQAPALAQNEMAVYEARQRDLAGRNAVLQEQLAQRRQEVVELQSRRELKGKFAHSLHIARRTCRA